MAVLASICVESCGNRENMAQVSLRLSGSTSMEKLSGAWAEGFMEKYPGVNVSIEFVGSSAGIEAVLSGGADIGNSSRSLKDDEKRNGAAENLVALDGIVVCVDPANTIDGLTCSQLTGLYTGVVRNWLEIGGPDVPVVVVGREAGSGTRSAFEEILGVTDQCDYANELDSAGAVMARVASTPGAVGYVSLGVADDSVKKLSLEGAEPAAENIRNGSYPLVSPFVMATRGKITEQNELVRRWFDYVYSEEGRTMAARLGFIPADGG
ncbi:MAG: phosphate ABC transporter substrate-binding protein [Blautia sp.]|nr:phosphate ABC transporter substrate-binding protein [Blautia sp.]